MNAFEAVAMEVKKIPILVRVAPEYLAALQDSPAVKANKQALAKMANRQFEESMQAFFDGKTNSESII